jgi:hypothetical protein
MEFVPLQRGTRGADWAETAAAAAHLQEEASGVGPDVRRLAAAGGVSSAAAAVAAVGGLHKLRIHLTHP